jgi:putative Mg2+ transporter-C (MgtC) family protein
MSPDIWLVRLLSALACGGAIGLERQIHGRPAGLRTHILVALGSAIMTMAGLEVAGRSADGAVFDSGRIAAGVVTGIGFLGAGAIIRTRDLVRGLTTAACIWFVAGTGVACALGMLLESAIVTVLALAVLVLFGLLEERIPRIAYRDLVVEACGLSPTRLERLCTSILSRRGIRIEDVEVDAKAADATARLVFHIRMKRALGGCGLTEDLLGVEGIGAVAWRHQLGET